MLVRERAYATFISEASHHQGADLIDLVIARVREDPHCISGFCGDHPQPHPQPHAPEVIAQRYQSRLRQHAANLANLFHGKAGAEMQDPEWYGEAGWPDGDDI